MVLFNTKIHVSRIINLKYYDQFTDVVFYNLESFPKNLKILTFEKGFNQPLENKLLHLKITHLIFSCEFNQYICDCLPTTIIYLHFGNYYDKGFYYLYLPPNLLYLNLGNNLK